jgi:hypothetical protein
VGERLLADGADLAFDHRRICGGIARSGARAGARTDDPVLAQALFLVELLARIKLRLGLFILPSVPPRL